MGTRLFAFNTLAGAKRSSSAVVEDTTAGRFDSSYVANSIKVPDTRFIDTPPLFDGSSSVTELFLRFDIYGQFDVFSAVWLEFYNASGTKIAYLTEGAGADTIMQFDQWNGSSFNSSTHTYSTQATGLYTVEVRLKCGASGTCDIYLNGTLWMTFAVNQASVDNIAKVRMYTSASTTTSYYSQVMGADYDIRDHHLMSKLASGEGNYTDGTGAYTDINETVLDDTNAISLPTVGNKHSFTKGSITVPSGQHIGALIVNARGRVNGAGPADGKLLCRSSSTDSASGNKSFVAGYEPRGHVYLTDPATGISWTESGFNSAEFGLQAS
jgi:hypothetical protein